MHACTCTRVHDLGTRHHHHHKKCARDEVGTTDKPSPSKVFSERLFENCLIIHAAPRSRSAYLLQHRFPQVAAGLHPSSGVRVQVFLLISRFDNEMRVFPSATLLRTLEGSGISRSKHRGSSFLHLFKFMSASLVVSSCVHIY